MDDNGKTFVEFLKSWEGKWTWDGLILSEDPSWVAKCLKNGTLVCVTDGSYNKQVAPDVCSAGWVMACLQTKRQISGTLIERSEYAGSYRGELLGMLAIWLFLLAVEEYHNTISDNNEVWCDNKEALFTFEKKSKRVPTGKTNTDVLCVLRTINSRTKSNFVQHHVKAYQDEYTQFIDLSFEAQLNCYCDSLAKKEIEEYQIKKLEVKEEEDETLPIRHLLPLESARVFVNGVKQTTDVKKGLKRDIRRQQAKEFYSKRGS